MVSISTKLTLIYAAILCCILMLTSLLTAVGIYFSLYHQAEVELEISIEHVLDELQRGAPVFDPGFMRTEPLLPGVVLRVTDENGKVIFDTMPHYPSLQDVQANIETDPPFWANKSMEVVRLHNFHLYYEMVEIVRDGHSYHLHFLRTITAESHFLAMLRDSLLLTNLLGVVIALLAGYFVSRRILRPIRTLTQTARKLEVTDLSQRIEVRPTHDELSELANTFNHMLDRIQAGFDQQRRFVSDASHELRTPVTVIRGYSDMLSRWGRQDAEVLDEGIAAIRSEAEDMQALIEKLLFLARADQQRQVLHKEPLMMSELVADVVKKAQMVDQKHEICLQDNEEAEILADAVVMRQMLRIFIENSRKYTPEGGRIIVSSVRDQGKLRVVVADNGIGIAPENQKKVFDRFFRVDSSRTKDGSRGVGGTGLGLSIAHWIAVQHDIELQIESELGKGTQMIMLIPIIG